jgi:ATP-dependent DNA helicase RecG
MKDSECYLFGEPKTDEGRERLRILAETSDGFRIAEEDLRLRGPGDFWGARQSGEPFFRLADPVRDGALLVAAREAAMPLVKGGLLESDPAWAGLKNYLDQMPLQY